MQRKSRLMQFILVMLAVTMVSTACFSTKKQRQNGGKHRCKLSYTILPSELDKNVIEDNFF